MCYAFFCVGSIVIVETPILTTVGIITIIIEALGVMVLPEVAWVAVAVATHFDGKKY